MKYLGLGMIVGTAWVAWGWRVGVLALTCELVGYMVGYGAAEAETERRYRPAGGFRYVSVERLREFSLRQEGIEGPRPVVPLVDEAALDAAERAYWRDYGVSRHNLRAAIQAYLATLKVGDEKE